MTWYYKSRLQTYTPSNQLRLPNELVYTSITSFSNSYKRVPKETKLENPHEESLQKGKKTSFILYIMLINIFPMYRSTF